MSNFSRTERFIFWTCATIFCAFSYFLYDDTLLFNQELETKNKNIGSFNLSLNDVRRKTEESFLWRPVSNTEKIYLRDSIFTGSNSRAVLTFDDGSVIEVKENSMITLNMNQGQIQLDLRYGDLVTALNEKSQLEVTAGTQKFDLTPQSGDTSKVQIQKSRTKKVKIKLLEGKAQFTDKKSNERLTLLKEKPLLIAPANSLAKKDEVIKLKSSISLVTLDKTPITLFNKGEAFPVEWTATELNQFRVEISPALDFSKTIYTSLTSVSPHSVTASLERGWYFWRVVGINDSQQEVTKSEVRRLFVSYFEAPRITSPDVNQDLSFEVEAPAGKDFATATTLSWSSVATYGEYEWQLSDTPVFTAVAASQKTKQTSVKLEKLKAGIYYARVRGLLPNEKRGPWSEARNWKVSVTEKRAAPLELITKNIIFNPVQAQRNPAAVQAPSVNWKGLADAKTYLIELSKTKDFKVKETFETESLQWNWTQYKVGNHYFRVWAKRTQGRTSLPSEIGSIKVILSVPEISPLTKIFEKSEKIGMPAPPKNVNLTWTQIPFAKTYLLEVDKDPAFKAPIKREISSNTEQFELPKPGQYHARVRAYDENQQALTDYSPPQTIVYEYRTQLAAPTLEEPRHEVNVFLQKDIEPFLWLVWSKDPSAVSYEIEVASDKDFKRIIIKDKVITDKDNNVARYLIRRKIPLGPIYWRVKAIAPVREDSSDWSRPWLFNLLFKINENSFE